MNVNNLPYGVLRAFLTPFLMLAFRPKVKGLRNVPSSGPVIIASNHLSFSDSIFMPLVVPRKVTFLAKSEYFTSPGPKGLLKKLTFIALGQVPVDRSGGRRSEAALITGLQVLAEGECLGIYPEGTRSPDGRYIRDEVELLVWQLNQVHQLFQLPCLIPKKFNQLEKLFQRLCELK